MGHDLVEACKTLLEEFFHGFGVFFLVLQGGEDLQLYTFNLNGIPEISGVKMVDQFDAFRFGFVYFIRQVRIVGNFQDHFQSFNPVEIRISCGCVDAKLTGQLHAPGIRIDVGHAHDDRLQGGAVLLLEVCDQFKAERTTSHNGDLGSTKKLQKVNAVFSAV